MNEQISRSIDILRFPLACGVVVLHLMGSYTNWSAYDFSDFCKFGLYDHVSLATNIFFQVAVPLFFFISGYLYTKGYDVNIKKVISKKSKSILLPYMLWNIMAYLLLVVTKGLGVVIHGRNIHHVVDVVSPLSFLQSVIGDFSGGFPCSPIDAPLWFMRDLFILFLLAPIFVYGIKRMGSFIVFVFLALYIFNVKGIPCLQVQSITFFVLGLYFRLHKIDYLAFFNRYKGIMGGIALCSFGLRYVLGGQYTLLMPLFIISASVYIISVSDVIKTDFADKVIGYKKYSFWIYALHFLLVQKMWGIFYHPLLRNNEVVASIAYIVCPIVVIFLCKIAYDWMEKVAPRILAVLVGGRI